MSELCEGISFDSSVKIKAVLGYGLAIFDSDLEYDRDNVGFCDIWEKVWEITENIEFLKFSNSRNVEIQKWQCEYSVQMWIVDKFTYVETTGFAPLGQLLPTDKSRIEEVKFELFRCLKEKTGWKADYDGDCEWGLTLFYE